jgi:PAS domain S-box-containing protein
VGGQGNAFDFQSILAIADALPVMVAYCDRNQIYRFCNRAIAEWFELPRGDILGKTVREILGEDAYAVRKDALEAALSGERQWFAASFDHPRLGAKTTQADYVPHTAADGTVIGVVMLIQDLTEQRAAEVAMRESEARFRRIANFAPVIMWVTRADRSRDFVNQAYANFIGLDQDAARTADWYGYIHPDDLARLTEESLAGEATLKPFTLEGRYRRHDGEWRWLRSVSSPRFGADGKLTGFIGTAIDVTAEKESEEELRRQVDARTRALSSSEQRFRAIVDTVLEVIVLMAPDGTVLDLNRSPMAWRAPDPEQAIGKKLWESPTLSMYPAQIEPLKEFVRQAAEGRHVRREITLERNGRAVATLDFSLTPIRGADGSVEILVLENRDITELKQAQEQLRQSQKMEALGQLTGGIAHDFNNLLTVVVGGLDMVTRQIEEPRALRYAQNALAAAERGARLTAQLLAFSRVQRLEVRPVRVTKQIEEMRPLLRNVLGPRINKHFELEADLPPVMADPTQLEVALLNLAINARDAMPEGGDLTISSIRKTVVDDADLEPGDYVELTISDTGHGMKPDVMARAFDPFFTTKEAGKGTGLGLSMVYGMARQSGGTARIHSRETGGTSVCLFFRTADDELVADELAGATLSPDGRTRAGESVLVIDDDAAVRSMLAASLAENGYEVHEASDGPSGIDMFERVRPDVVVLDFIMPGMTGADVAERILATHPGQKILFVSGYSETDAIRRVAPMAEILAKPFRPTALDKAIRGLIDPEE